MIGQGLWCIFIDYNHQSIVFVIYINPLSHLHIVYYSLGGNELPNQPYQLNWSWISLDREYYEVNETTKYLEIKLKRRGYLGETSFVGKTMKDEHLSIGMRKLYLEIVRIKAMLCCSFIGSQLTLILSFLYYYLYLGVMSFTMSHLGHFISWWKSDTFL